MDMLFSNYLHTLTGNLFVRLVLWCVVLDTALGCLRAVKYRNCDFLTVLNMILLSI